MRLKRAIAIHDMCGFGRCSLTVALPVLSSMGVQCCPLPTAFFSSSPNIEGYFFEDMTSAVEPALRHWAALGLDFDGIYSGYLTGAAQTALVETAASLFPGALVIVDPVMGDGGKPYGTCSAGLISAMRRLVLKADVITPNLTEACLLLGKDPALAPGSERELSLWMDELSGGRRSVALTGIETKKGEISTAWLDAGTGEGGLYAQPFAGRFYHGTGDIFASVLTGALLGGKPFGRAVETASRFARDCAAHTYGRGAPERDGVLFEELLRGYEWD